MTAPGAAVSMEDIGKELEAAAKAGVDPTEVKLEGDKIPEALRGKTLADVLRETEVLNQSLKIANDARKAAEERGSVPPVATPPAAVVESKKRMTKEALAELFEQDPVSAVAYMNEIAIQDAAETFERRFSALSASSSQSAETAARTKFSDEFALFDKEIKDVTAAMPDKSILANPQAWDNIIAFIRGKPGNFERFIEARNTKAAVAAAEAARDAEDRGAGASLTSSVRSAPASKDVGDGGYGLSKEELRIAETMDMSPKDYAYWKKIGG